MVLREIIKYWRSKSIRIIMYLDDGLGGADTFEKCKDVNLVVKHDLFNFVINKKESYLFCPE
jgi:hypothetical protein